MIRRFFAFMIALAFGIVPFSKSFDDNISIRIVLDNQAGVLRYGERIRLRCYVDGIYEPYDIHWQCLRDPELPEWETMDVSGDTYEYILTTANVDYYYRVVVVCDDNAYTSATNTDLKPGGDPYEKTTQQACTTEVT